MKISTLKKIACIVVASAILLTVIIVGGHAAWRTDDYLEHSLNQNTATQYGEWIQTQDTYYDGQAMPWFFYTCSNNGRKEGTIYFNKDGTWHAQSEQSGKDWHRVDGDFRTQALAKKAVEDFVQRNELCK